uniref:Uncharacterized protein n=1 Tax=Tetradesmus obliquus TaxID=3088 RepID=A0A383VGM6_TETOB|eukprot:jgi/Sobl393_1/15899/SZX63814.1
MGGLLASLLASAAAVTTAADWNTTAGYNYSYSFIESAGGLQGTQIAFPARYISFHDYSGAAGYFGNLSGWATAPGMQQHLLVALLLLVLLFTKVDSAARIAELEKRCAEFEAAAAAAAAAGAPKRQQPRVNPAELEATTSKKTF